MSASDGTAISSISYFPFGLTRNGSVNTTKEFTGQRLDSTGLYYYNARYYDPQIGRFISPDSTGQDLNNPQTFNRYSYCLNNPLNRTDPSGHQSVWMLRYLSWRYTNNFASQIQVTDQCLLLNVGNLCNGFHEIAQINAAKALSKTDVFGVTLEEKLGKNCEADIVGGSQVWEVKPALNSKGENAAEQADDQLTKYCAMGDLKRGDNLGMNPIMDIPIVGDIKMKVDFDQDNRGVISYSFYNSGDPDQVLDPDAVKNSVLLYLLGSALVKIGEMGLGLDGGGLSPGGDPVGIPVSP
jgi:RHS repeat-associated protein